MDFALSLDHLFKVLISCNNDALFGNRPIEDFPIFHPGVPLGNLDNIMPLSQQPASQDATRIDIHQELHLSSHAVYNSFACDQMMCVEQGRSQIIWL